MNRTSSPFAGAFAYRKRPTKIWGFTIKFSARRPHCASAKAVSRAQGGSRNRSETPKVGAQ